MNRVYLDSKFGVMIIKADHVERDAENYKLIWGNRRRLIPVDKVLMIEDDGVEPLAPRTDVVRPPIPTLPTAFQREVAKNLADVAPIHQQEDVSIRPAQIRVEWAGDATGSAIINSTIAEASNPNMTGELAKVVFAHPGIKSALTDFQVVNLEKHEGAIFMQVRRRAAATGDMKSMQAAMSALHQKLEVNGIVPSPPSAFDTPVRLNTDEE